MAEHSIAEDLRESRDEFYGRWYDEFVALGLEQLQQRLRAEAAMDDCDRVAGR